MDGYGPTGERVQVLMVNQEDLPEVYQKVCNKIRKSEQASALATIEALQTSSKSDLDELIQIPEFVNEIDLETEHVVDPHVEKINAEEEAAIQNLLESELPSADDLFQVIE